MKTAWMKVALPLVWTLVSVGLVSASKIPGGTVPVEGAGAPPPAAAPSDDMSVDDVAGAPGDAPAGPPEDVGDAVSADEADDEPADPEEFYETRMPNYCVEEPNMSERERDDHIQKCVNNYMGTLRTTMQRQDYKNPDQRLVKIMDWTRHFGTEEGYGLLAEEMLEYEEDARQKAAEDTQKEALDGEKKFYTRKFQQFRGRGRMPDKVVDEAIAHMVTGLDKEWTQIVKASKTSWRANARDQWRNSYNSAHGTAAAAATGAAVAAAATGDSGRKRRRQAREEEEAEEAKEEGGGSGRKDGSDDEDSEWGEDGGGKMPAK